MRFMSYAEIFEDALLPRARHDVNDGCYIDIGVQEPVGDSLSLAFYQAGWSGVRVEPVPYFGGSLRCEQPEETITQAAVADRAEPIPLHETPTTGFATHRADMAERRNEAGFYSRSVIISTIGTAISHWARQ